MILPWQRHNSLRRPGLKYAESLTRVGSDTDVIDVTKCSRSSRRDLKITAGAGIVAQRAQPVMQA